MDYANIHITVLRFRMFTMSQEKELYIKQYYDGDKARYEYETAEFDRHALSWKILKAYSECNEAHKTFVRGTIAWRLGFQPSESVIIPSSLYFCELVEDFLSLEYVTWERFQMRFDNHLKIVRNEHLLRNGWLNNLELGDKDLEKYQTFLPDFGIDAQKLIAEFLGYVPDLKSSLYAELTIRNIIAKTPWDKLSPGSQAEIHYHTITVIKYLDALFSQGRNAADQLPPLGFNWTGDFRPSVVH